MLNVFMDAGTAYFGCCSLSKASFRGIFEHLRTFGPLCLWQLITWLLVAIIAYLLKINPSSSALYHVFYTHRPVATTFVVLHPASAFEAFLALFARIFA